MLLTVSIAELCVTPMVSISAPSTATTNGAPGMCGLASVGPVGPGVGVTAGGGALTKNRRGGAPPPPLELLGVCGKSGNRKLWFFGFLLWFLGEFYGKTNRI